MQRAHPDDWAAVLDVVVLLRELASALPARRQRAALSAGADTVGAEVVSPGALAEELVAALLDEPEQNVIGALHWALVRLGDEAVTPLIEALDDPDAQVRGRVLAALADLPGPRSTAAVGALLGTPDSDPEPEARLRARAAIVVARRDPAEPLRGRTREALVKAIRTGANDVEAAETLAVLDPDGDAAAAILAACVPAAAPEERRRIAQALGEIPGAEARRVLGLLVEDSDRATSLTARLLLSRRTTPDG
ncbi:MAG: HEAT repeat domain-containing protein [Gordonia sp. (in: high G+C Gram-positive bacteria)]|uniref:HEAT repeat domain-containing protein n=1 Tax=Gordonia sp. (in: high G+C Gram-positive bacteria) TaxID=84139 RepID=UPI0039E44D49